MLWFLFKREAWLALVVYFSACWCSASAQVYPQAYYAPPVYYAPVCTPQGCWYPVARPTYVGNWLFGPLWVYQPRPQQPPSVPPPQQ